MMMMMMMMMMRNGDNRDCDACVNRWMDGCWVVLLMKEVLRDLYNLFIRYIL